MLKATKVFMGIICIGPILLWIAYMLISSLYYPDLPRGEIFQNIVTLMITAVSVGFIVSIVLSVRAFLGKGVPGNKRYAWGMLLLAGHVIVLPCYWYLCVWRGSY